MLKKRFFISITIILVTFATLINRAYQLYFRELMLLIKLNNKEKGKEKDSLKHSYYIANDDKKSDFFGQKSNNQKFH